MRPPAMIVAQDIDMAVDSLDHPGRYPLVSRALAKPTAGQTRGHKRRRKSSESLWTGGRETV